MPSTTITLCRVPWNNDGIDQPYFATEGRRTTYFNSLPVSSVSVFNNCTLVKGGRLSVPTPYMDFFKKYNYCYFTQNSMTVYAFIEDFISDNLASTTVVYTVDYWTTYTPTCKLGSPSLIERCSPNTTYITDQPGDIQPGGYKLETYEAGFANSRWALLIYTIKAASGTEPTYDFLYLNSAVPTQTRVLVARDKAEAKSLSAYFAGDFSQVISAYWIPNEMLNGIVLTGVTPSAGAVPFYELSGEVHDRKSAYQYATIDVSAIFDNSQTTGHSPTTYYTMAVGTKRIKIAPENIDPTGKIFIKGGLSPAPYLIAEIPYNGTSSYQYITEDAFPIAQITTDTFGAWIQQKGTSALITGVTAVAALIAGAVTGGAGGVAVLTGGATMAAGTLANIAGQYNAPDSSTAGSSEALMASGGWRVQLEKWTATDVNRIKALYEAKGYPVNRVAVPLYAREGKSYTYLKISDPVIKGGPPEPAKRSIAAKYAAGVRLWNDISRFGNL